MEPKATLDEARGIMLEFADQTGLSDNKKPPSRYLWTDAFAVCNFLSLYHETRDEGFRRLALDLVDQVHATLGRHREDDPRTGWISGLDEAAGAQHPTVGGLRIGKTLNERQSDEPFDERLEWDRDGQYYHYLTKWMHALERVGSATAEPKYVRWATELAKAAHAAFVFVQGTGGARGMYWKMSIDLSHPLVPSMGLHDPLDGFVTYNALRMYALQHPSAVTMPDLSGQIAEMKVMCRGMDYRTDDPLGIGGLLFDACRAAQMTVAVDLEADALMEAMLVSSRYGLEALRHKDWLHDPADHRLAFRELGLSIGLRALEKTQEIINNNRSRFRDQLFRQTEELAEYLPLGRAIEGFWRDPARQGSASWRGNQNINMVMYATSLMPEELLSL